MNPPCDNAVAPATFGPPSSVSDGADGPSFSDFGVRPPQTARTGVQSGDWDRRSERWGHLMIAAQAGESQAYEQLLRELNAWLRRYYTHRLPRPAAEDAAQEALLAIHAKRHTYAPSRSLGAWVIAIARYKSIDRLRDAFRYFAVSLDDEMPVEHHGQTAISAAALANLLDRLKLAQASVIRLVKLRGLTIARVSGATGQSASLVKTNVHRSLKKMAALVS